MKLTIKTPADLATARAQVARNTKRAKAQAYLTATDWMVVRQAETGEPVPEDVLKRRRDSRALLAARVDGNAL